MAENTQKKETTFIFNTSSAPDSIIPALAIDVVDACNLGCTTCTRGLRRMKNHLAQMDFDLYKQILAKAKNLGFSRIYLYNWTEPFLCRDLPRYLEAAKSSDFATQLSSNLSFRKIPQLIPSLKFCDTLIVSVSGFTQPVYKINHRGGNVENVKKQLEIIAQARTRGEISTEVVMRFFNFPHSRHEFQLFEKFAEDLGLKILLWHGGGEPGQNSPKSQKFWDYVIDGKLNPTQPAPQEHTRKICYTALNPFILDCKGDAYLCCAAPNCARTRIGNFLEDDFHTLMYRRFSHFLCKNCARFKPVEAPAHYASWMAKGLLKEYGIKPDKLCEIGEEMKIIEKLANREVYFYGCGGMLRRKMHEYADCKPKYILADQEKRPQHVNGIPVAHPDEALDDANPLPIVIFAGKEAARAIREKLRAKWPAHKEIYCCLPS